MRAVLVVPADQGIDFAAHRRAAERDQNPAEIFLERADCSLHDRDAPVLPNGAEARADAAMPAPPAVSGIRPELATFVADEITRRGPRGADCAAEEYTQRGAGRRGPKDRRADDPPRVMGRARRQSTSKTACVWFVSTWTWLEVEVSTVLTELSPVAARHDRREERRDERAGQDQGPVCVAAAVPARRESSPEWGGIRQPRAQPAFARRSPGLPNPHAAERPNGPRFPTRDNRPTCVRDARCRGIPPRWGLGG